MKLSVVSFCLSFFINPAEMIWNPDWISRDIFFVAYQETGLRGAIYIWETQNGILNGILTYVPLICGVYVWLGS